MTDPWDELRPHLAELTPLLRRTADLDPGGVVRLRTGGNAAGLLVWLPFSVLAGRTVAAPGIVDADITVRGADLLSWLDAANAAGAASAARPVRRDDRWRSSSPPDVGWQRVDTIPDGVIRALVRTGALALKDAAAREGVPGAQPRAAVADALLDAIVLTVTADERPTLPAQITLRGLSALTRLGFVARDSAVHVDRSGRWLRLTATYGSIYLTEPGGLPIASL